MLTVEMGRYDDQARRRIKAWMAANPEITLTKLGQAAGYNQPWASRWITEEFDASLEALAGMAALFRQPLSALFETREDPREEELLTRFRGMPERRQQLILDTARDYVPDEPAPRGRARSRKRNGG
jgi:transcriptional regulator with XRE-family HTH domain